MTNIKNENDHLWKRALALSLFTIFYNIAEGWASLLLGVEDGTLSLFGFGVDSFIEVLSAIGVTIMIQRIRYHPEMSDQKSEKLALKTTGISFYLLSVGLAIGIVFRFIQHQQPESTYWGIIISIVSLLVMTLLFFAKLSTGKRLNSVPLIADAGCTKICMYMSIVLLLSSLIYRLTGFVYADLLGAVGLIWFSVSEGKEALEKARGKAECNC